MAGKKRKSAKKPARKKSGSGSNSKVMTAIIVGVALALGIVGGIIAWSMTNNSDSLALPDFAYAATAPKRAPEGYQAALDIPEYLEQVPCYCGCGMYDGHKNNLDCFIKSRQGDKVEWDDHASGWDIWVNIALDVLQMKNNGMDIKDIRAKIDAEYASKGYTPTPTPPVE